MNTSPEAVAIIYAAKSTADVHGSIPTQLEDCRALAEREDLSVVDEFTDEAFSAFKGNRGPGLAAAQRKAEELAPCALIVQHTDRLSRGDGIQAQHLGEIFFWATRNGVTIRSCQDDLLTDPRMGALMAAVAGMRNSEDSLRKSEATKAGKKREAERGRPHGGIPPYGYHYEGRQAECRLIPDAAEAAIVRRIFERFAGGESQLSITRSLNADGITTRSGRRWAQGTVSGILKNPTYIGKVRHRDALHDGAHEPMIEADLWHRVESLLGRPKGAGPGGRRPKGPHLFTAGLLRCQCGYALVPRTNTRGWRQTYQCLGRIENGPDFCAQQPIARELIDTAALQYFESVALDVEGTRAQFEQALDTRRGEIATGRQQAQSDAMKNAAARDRVERDYLAGDLPNANYVRLTARLDEESAALAAQLAQIEAQAADLEAEADMGDAEAAFLAHLTEIRAAIAGHVQNADGVEAVRAALRTLFDRFEYWQYLESRDHGDYAETVKRFELWPYVREDAIDPERSEMFIPRPRRVALGGRAKNYSTASATAYLFAPIAGALSGRPD